MSETPKNKHTYVPSKAARRYLSRARAGIGRMTPDRIAFAVTFAGQIALYRVPNDPELAQDEEEKEMILNSEIGPNYRLSFIRQGRFKPLNYFLTSFTEEELDAAKALLDLAFELAYPIVRERDRMAQDALSDGDDSFTRIYRQAPQFVVREREAAEHDKSLLDRSRATFDRNRLGRDSSGSTGVSGPVLAPGESSQGEAQDDGTQTDESADLREVGGTTTDVLRLPSTGSGAADAPPSPGGD